MRKSVPNNDGGFFFKPDCREQDDIRFDYFGDWPLQKALMQLGCPEGRFDIESHALVEHVDAAIQVRVQFFRHMEKASGRQFSGGPDQLNIGSVLRHVEFCFIVFQPCGCDVL
ncbi:MAG TPA: hypothetical protein VK249_02110 [Anaerolineales bacterium]|nr:hypothetical protein [Anaerolineales bacterium]